MDAVPVAPDFLGQTARIDTIAAMIQTAQQQIQSLETSMTLYGLTEDAPLRVENAPATTYGERMRTLRNGIERLWDDNADVHEELIAAAVRRRDKLASDIQRGPA